MIILADSVGQFFGSTPQVNAATDGFEVYTNKGHNSNSALLMITKLV